MDFVDTGIEGLWLIRPAPYQDERGSFTRTFCAREFAARGMATEFVQHSLSRSNRKHTLRGLHFQVAPHAEAKLVACARGALWDVAVDLRPGAPTRGCWYAAELTADNCHQLYIPVGFAHGFITLCDQTVTRYLMSAFFAPEAASGVRFDDPELAIDWPAAPACISDRDLAWPRLAERAL